ncbi:hypothetical protein Pla123a_41490 [Posidoniimonas polymericola]|uniref:UPF0235 protein Pla123a_41490 n=1 Tax=Posidoniimonas polymericola TaxID=2528002 RepID=A0A5C5XZ83_9BACT|nr:DUF167 domain-containing protein [Posidoniimonas polymericola]TWT67593.1 hypothetical protein Pla123a_41490 [Posidoniimonas polymericola]
MADTLDLVAHPRGLLLPVKARAGAGRNAVTGVRAGELLVSVTQAPEKGKANAAIAKVLAKQLGLRASEIQIASGETNPHKKFLLVGADEAAVRQSVAAVTGG